MRRRCSRSRAGSELAEGSGLGAQDHLRFVHQVTGGVHNKVEQASVTEGAEQVILLSPYCHTRSKEQI